MNATGTYWDQHFRAQTYINHLKRLSIFIVANFSCIKVRQHYPSHHLKTYSIDCQLLDFSTQKATNSVTLPYLKMHMGQDSPTQLVACVVGCSEIQLHNIGRTSDTSPFDFSWFCPHVRVTSVTYKASFTYRGCHLGQPWRRLASDQS